MDLPNIPEPTPTAARVEDVAADTGRHDVHFSTDHLLKNLSGRAISGGMVTASAQATRFGLYTISTVLLARLLSKEDFGLVAMVATLTSFLRLFREAGLATATVQQKSITHAQVSNLFWINVGLGVAAMLVGAAFAPIMAWFFRDPRLVGITLVLSSTFILSGSAVQHLGLLNRQMRFKAIACVDVTSMALGLAVGVGMAWAGCGYWSLVGSQVAQSIGELSMAWIMSGWRPQLPQKNAGTRSMVHLGASLTGSLVLRQIAGGSDSILIGRVYGAVSLGIYSRGMALLVRPLDQFSGPFDKVFVPMLSRLQDDPARYRRTFLQIYNAMVLASFVIAGLLFGLSRPLVLVMLGRKWAEVVPVFAALTIAATYYQAGNSSLWLLTTQGRNRDILQTGMLISFVSIASFSVGLMYGVTGVALAYSLGGLLVRLPAQYYIVGRSGPVTTNDLWRVLLRQAPIWVVSSGTAYGAVLATAKLAPVLQLCVGIPAALAASFLVIWILPHQRETAVKVIRETTGFVKKLIKKT